MTKSVAIVGAGVSGLTCGVLFAERGYAAKIFAEQIGTKTTSGAAGALWFPYDAEPADKVIPWALATYKVLVDLTKDPRSGVSMIELRQNSRRGKISIPEWIEQLKASWHQWTCTQVGRLTGGREKSSRGFCLTSPPTTQHT